MKNASLVYICVFFNDDSYLWAKCNQADSLVQAIGATQIWDQMVGQALNLSKWQCCQWLFLVPLKGGRDYITSQKAIYKWYILPIGGLYTTYHPLQEPEKSIDVGPQTVSPEKKAKELCFQCVRLL